MKHFVLAGFLLLSQVISAQKQDSLHVVLQKAQGFIALKDYSGAFLVLRDFNLGNSDVSALRLQAQVAYWMQLFPVSDSLYRVAATKSPGMPALDMEYGRFLFETGRYKEAYPLLSNAANHPEFFAEAELDLAYIDYWNLAYADAKQKMNELLKIYPDYKAAKDLSTELTKVLSPHFVAGVHYISDDQPYQQTRISLKAYKVKSKWFAPEATVNAAFLQPDNLDKSQTLETWIGNTLTIGTKGPSIGIKGGGFFHSKQSKAEGIYDISLMQPLGKGLKFSVQALRVPYQYTINSAPIALIEKKYIASLALEHPKAWLGKVAWEMQQFPDDKKVMTAYLWAMAPIINKQQFLLQAGYGFTYANSDSLRFVPKPENGTHLPGEIEGWYNPYFTPKDQQVHAALFAAKWIMSVQVTMYVNAQYGFAATNTTAWYYRTNPGNNSPVLKGTQAVAYHPASISFAFTWKLNEKLSMLPGYTYEKLFFYTSHRAGLKFIW